ncbi:hypothetical protein [Cryobacterium sp. SO1]|uniref:hypothetical protein n=1 Tax=Cryobacterium sp. SO1 TaxID=1897061 RepID=UPI001023182F|nr:hypothetical protein [Cryobacterium sp. SO1]RZI37290.1 hypothetical protein BJQ95_00280 [Cryobacterium sp. SO1]
MTRTISTSAPESVPARRAVAAVQLGDPEGRSTRSTHRQLIRPEIRSSGSVVAITLASVIIAGCLYSGTELVLELTGRQPLLAAPSAVLPVVSQVNQIAPAILFTVGVLVAIPGLVLVLVALLPGRLARHEAGSDRAAVIVDDVDVPVSRPGTATQPIPQAGAALNRFTAAKAIAEAIAYDALRSRTAATRGPDTLLGSKQPSPQGRHPTANPTVLTNPTEKERTL